MSAPERRLLIGCAERVDLPAWRVRRLRAKVDTGARSSSLHVEDIEERAGGRVRFFVVLDKDARPSRVAVEADIARRAPVRSSGGEREVRYFVRTPIAIGPVIIDAEISLTSRSDMRFRMLLGRSTLAGAVLIDPARRYVVDRRRRASSTKDKKPAKKKPRTGDNHR